jgi:hypothetical protein
MPTALLHPLRDPCPVRASYITTIVATHHPRLTSYVIIMARGTLWHRRELPRGDEGWCREGARWMLGARHLWSGWVRRARLGVVCRCCIGVKVQWGRGRGGRGQGGQGRRKRRHRWGWMALASPMDSSLHLLIVLEIGPYWRIEKVTRGGGWEPIKFCFLKSELEHLTSMEMKESLKPKAHQPTSDVMFWKYS